MHLFLVFIHTVVGVVVCSNQLKNIRKALMLSKTELARKAKVATVTIDRIERGLPCRLETKRKVLLALGYKVSDVGIVFNN